MRNTCIFCVLLSLDFLIASTSPNSFVTRYFIFGGSAEFELVPGMSEELATSTKRRTLPEWMNKDVVISNPKPKNKRTNAPKVKENNENEPKGNDSRQQTKTDDDLEKLLEKWKKGTFQLQITSGCTEEIQIRSQLKKFTMIQIKTVLKVV